MQVINSRFAANSASRGGAIYSSGASVTVMNSQFSGNAARTTGGALYCADQSALTVLNTTFTNNMAGAGTWPRHAAFPAVLYILLQDLHAHDCCAVSHQQEAGLNPSCMSGS